MVKKNIVLIASVVVVVAIIGVVVFFQGLFQQQMIMQKEEQMLMVEEGPNVGQLAPDFTLRSIDGREFSLSDFRGKNVLLWFMLPKGCPICKSQVEVLKRIQEDFGDDVVVLVVTFIGDEKDMMEFRDQSGLPQWIYAIDDKGIGVKYMIVEMGVIVIDPNGIITLRGIPQASYDEIASALKT